MNNQNNAIETFENAISNDITRENIKNWLKDQSLPYRELMAFYKCAMMEVETKFKVLNEEFSLDGESNPIESIRTRLKSPESIIDKMMKRKCPLSVSGIEENIKDIAGVRVICSFQSDIYMLAEAIVSQDDVQLIEIKDYIKKPKPNGYRSLHLIIAIPIFLHDEKRMMNVEVQLRTLAMDLWACLEHKILYKKNLSCNKDDLIKELKVSAEMCAEVDDRMEDAKEKSQCKEIL